MKTGTRGDPAVTGEDKLIEQYIDPDPHGLGFSEARLCEYGVSVWALVGYLRVVDGGIEEVADAYELPREAVEAALLFYRRHKDLIDARLLLNTA